LDLHSSAALTTPPDPALKATARSVARRAGTNSIIRSGIDLSIGVSIIAPPAPNPFPFPRWQIAQLIPAAMGRECDNLLETFGAAARDYRCTRMLTHDATGETFRRDEAKIFYRAQFFESDST